LGAQEGTAQQLCLDVWSHLCEKMTHGRGRPPSHASGASADAPGSTACRAWHRQYRRCTVSCLTVHSSYRELGVGSQYCELTPTEVNTFHRCLHLYTHFVGAPQQLRGLFSLPAHAPILRVACTGWILFHPQGCVHNPIACCAACLIPDLPLLCSTRPPPVLFPAVVPPAHKYKVPRARVVAAGPCHPDHVPGCLPG
jgi:hypothetical protein